MALTWTERSHSSIASLSAAAWSGSRLCVIGGRGSVVSDDAGIKAAFIVSKRQYPRSAWLAVEFMGGDGMNDWIELVVERLTGFATESGLAGLEMAGRKGWTRVLAASGWRENAVLLVKSVDKKAG